MTQWSPLRRSHQTGTPAAGAIRSRPGRRSAWCTAPTFATGRPAEELNLIANQGPMGPRAEDRPSPTAEASDPAINNAGRYSDKNGVFDSPGCPETAIRWARGRVRTAALPAVQR